MDTNKDKLKNFLISNKLVNKNDIEKAEKDTANNDSSFIDYLIDHENLTRNDLGKAMAELQEAPYFDLRANMPNYGLISKIPEKIAREYRVILTKKESDSMHFVSDKIAKAEKLFLKMKNIFPVEKIVLSYALSEDIDFVLDYFYKKPLKTRFSDIIAGGKRIAQEIVNEIFKDALSYNSSDIHFEPQDKETIIRFRVDGVLQEAGRISKEYYNNILNFIKVQSDLRIDERNSAQDGSMKHSIGNKEIDLRISILPVIHGEKIAIRVLSKYIKGFNLHEIGLKKEDRNLIKNEIKRPFGMVLASGPTGSGKTTTLYSLLKLLNNPRINMTTLEDPVEYRIKGVNQIQVNPNTNLTFLKGLRSIIRQDPDIIMVGEIRDNETAEMAVNSALTGHLLFSSFHANNASTTIARLLDMNIEPFLLSSTLRVIIAQRLIRKLCEKCRYSINVSKEDLERYHKGVSSYFKKGNNTIFQSRGCESCGFTGYKGRTAIFEIIINSLEMQDLILSKPSSKQIWQLAKKQGTKSLFADGINKVKDGTTSLEELLRITLP